MPNPLSLTEVRALPPGTYVNDGFIARVLSIDPKQAKASGRNFWVCKLEDPANPVFSVEMAIFNPPSFAAGQIITASGRGIKFEVGTYGPKISVSDKTLFTNASFAAPQTPNPTPLPAPQTPKTPTLPPPTSRTAPEGQTIGMAVKLAGDVLMHNARCEGKPVDLASLSGHLWEVAGAIIEACDGLKTGVKPTDALPF